MNEFATVHTAIADSHMAGTALGLQISEALSTSPDVVILFAAPSYDHAILLKSLQSTCHPEKIIGSTSMGAFTGNFCGETSACALAIRSSEDMQFSLGIGQNVRDASVQAAHDIISSFRPPSPVYRYRYLFLLVDGVMCHTDDFLDQLAVLDERKHLFFGASGADYAQFRHIALFYNTEVFSNAVVALEILSLKPLGIGAAHHWEPSSYDMFVTETEGLRLISIDDAPAVEAFRKYAQERGRTFDISTPRFFLDNLIGMRVTTHDGYKLRVPVRAMDDGSVLCASEIPRGATIRFMSAPLLTALDAVPAATDVALRRFYGQELGAALFFDCAATRLRMGDRFDLELRAVRESLGDARYAGCYTLGQILRTEGQYNGMLNGTPLVCLFPR